MRRLSSPSRAAAAFLFAAAALQQLAVPALAASATVTISTGLSPRTLTITPGTTVIWRNADDDRHRMRSRGGPAEFDSGNLDPGASFRLTFTLAGTYAYLDDRNREASAYWGTIVVSSRTTSTATPSVGGSGGTSSQPAGGGTSLVRVANRAFVPSTLTVVAGTTVRWRNDDDRQHTISSTDRLFDSGGLSSGGSWSRTFATPGTFRYLCQIHPEMRGTIAVRASASATAPPAPAAPQPKVAAPGSGSASGSTAARIVDFAFAPASISIAAGTSVTWTNLDPAPHTVTATDGSWDSGLIDPDGTFSRRFATPGTFTFACLVHPSMTGTIRVGAAGPVGGSAAGTQSPAEAAAGAGPSTPPPAPDSAAASPPPSQALDDGPGAAPGDAPPTSDASATVRFGIAGMLWIGAVGLFLAFVRGAMRRT